MNSRIIKQKGQAQPQVSSTLIQSQTVQIQATTHRNPIFVINNKIDQNQRIKRIYMSTETRFQLNPHMNESIKFPKPEN
jgi:hypothetical protein